MKLAILLYLPLIASAHDIQWATSSTVTPMISSAVIGTGVATSFSKLGTPSVGCIDPPQKWDLMLVERGILPNPPITIKTFRTLEACEYAKASMRLDYERQSGYKSGGFMLGCAERQ